MLLTLAAVDCIQRGLANLRANWELVLVRLLQSVVGSSLVLVGFLPPLLAAGVDGAGLVERLAGGEGGWSSVLAEAWSREIGASAGTILPALGATLIFWLLAVLVFAFLEAGLLGVLVAGDRQAPTRARSSDWFRTFSIGHLAGWGRRLVWRILGLWLVALCLCMIWMLATAAWLGLSSVGGQRWGGAAALAIGCGGALPVLFGWAVVALWWLLAQALVADERAGFLASLVEALRLVGRRLGGLILIAFVLLVVGVTIDIVFLPLSVGTDLALADRFVPRLIAGSLLGLAQWLALSFVAVLCSATLVALGRAERRRPAESTT